MKGRKASSIKLRMRDGAVLWAVLAGLVSSIVLLKIIPIRNIYTVCIAILSGIVVVLVIFIERIPGNKVAAGDAETYHMEIGTSKNILLGDPVIVFEIVTFAVLSVSLICMAFFFAITAHSAFSIPFLGPAAFFFLGFTFLFIAADRLMIPFSTRFLATGRINEIESMGDFSWHRYSYLKLSGILMAVFTELLLVLLALRLIVRNAEGFWGPAVKLVLAITVGSIIAFIVPTNWNLRGLERDRK